MSELEKRLSRYVEEEGCTCTSVNSHKEKLESISTDFPGNFNKTITVLKAIAEENRLKILHSLTKSPLCACELEYILDVSQPTVAYHLQILRKAGLIRMLREGKWTSIELSHPEIMSLIENLVSVS